MNFFAPLNLLWLAPIGGAIIALYLLRLRRRDVTIPSVLLWQAATQDAQANAPFQKLRRNLLLFLQLLVALSLVFVLMRPFLWANGLGGKTTAIVLDASASMKATDVQDSRFAQAVREARALIEAKKPGDAVALIAASGRAITLCPLTTDREKLLTALKLAHATDTTGDMGDAIGFAASLVSSRAEARVLLITDGAFTLPNAVTLDGAKLDFLPLGKQAENVAITAFDVRDKVGGGRQAFVTVQYFGTSAQKKIPLEIRINGTLTDAHEILLKSGESHSEAFDNLRVESGGVAEARLDTRDDLSTDNTASVTLSPRRTIKILLVTAGNPFFERVLSSDEQVVLDTVSPANYKTSDSQSHDVTVWDDVPPPADLPNGHYLFWGGKSLGSGKLFPATAVNQPVSARPQILDWNHTHPLMHFADFADVKLREARRVSPAPWAQTLAETETGPLIIAGERNGIGGETRAIYVAFSLLDSDMPLRVAFPIFLTNCIEWLSARPGESNNGSLRPGDTVTLAALPGAGALTVSRPGGGTETLPALASGSTPVYDKTEQVGVYTVNGKNFQQTFAVSLLSPSESDITPVPKPVVALADAPKATGASEATQAEPTLARRDVWPFVAVAALIFLCVEWVAYHRRAA